MHLWSLAIEEQFYIFLPIIIGIVTKQKLRNFLIYSLITVVSFIFSIKTIYNSNILAFYNPFCRAWELMSGGLLAYIVYDQSFLKIDNALTKFIKSTFQYKIFKGENYLLQFLCSLGLIINLLCIFFLKKTNMFPGYYALLPVCGTLCIIAGGGKSWINKKILSNKIFISIGLISYPLYLFHWSFLSFLFIIYGDALNSKIKMISLLASFFISWIIYKYIEQPIRLSKDIKFIPAILIGLTILIGMFAHNVLINIGFNERNANTINAFPILPNNDERFLNLSVVCNSPKNKSSDKNYKGLFCTVNSQAPQFLVMGDSHVMSFAHSSQINNDLDMATVTLSSQPAFINYVSYSKTAHKKDQCIKNLKLFNQAVDKMLSSYKSIKYVVLVSCGPIYFSQQGFGIERKEFDLNNFVIEKVDNIVPIVSYQVAFIEGYVEMAKYLLHKGKIVILAIDVPELGQDPLKCFTRPFKLRKNPKRCAVERSAVNVRQKEYRVLVQQIQNRVPDLIIYDPINAFCDNKQCYGKKNNIIYYGDNNHLSLQGSILLSKHFKDWFFNQKLHN